MPTLVFLQRFSQTVVENALIKMCSDETEAERKRLLPLTHEQKTEFFFLMYLFFCNFIKHKIGACMNFSDKFYLKKSN